MKSFAIMGTTAVVVFALSAGLLVWSHPLRRLLSSTEIATVQIENRALRDAARAVVAQIEAKDKKRRKLNLIFSPDSLGEKVRERDGGVFGNPPIEGNAEVALYRLSYDYVCHFAIIEENTLLFYENKVLEEE